MKEKERRGFGGGPSARVGKLVEASDGGAARVGAGASSSAVRRRAGEGDGAEGERDDGSAGGAGGEQSRRAEGRAVVGGLANASG